MDFYCSDSSEMQQSSSNNSVASDATTNSASNAHGYKVMDERFCNLVVHQLGMALIQAMHGGDPSQIELLQREMRQFQDDTALDRILERAVIEWVSNEEDLSEQSEHHLRAKISKLIDDVHEDTGFHSAVEVPVSYSPYYYYHESCPPTRMRKMDIVLSESETSNPDRTTPVAVLGVGCDESEWWKGFDHNVKCIDAMRRHVQEDPRLEFEQPLLCVVLKVEGPRPPQQLKIKFGVWMCLPIISKPCKIMILLNNDTSSLKEASELFGRFLRVASSFAGWRNVDDPTYQYLGPNCCQVGDDVSMNLLFTCICCCCCCYFSIIL